MDCWPNTDTISPPALGEKLEPLLKKILGYLCQTRDMPLRSEIDSVGIVNASLKQFPTWQNEQELDCLRDGQTVEAIFDVLVERAMQDGPEPRETGPRLQIAEQILPAVNGGNDGSAFTPYGTVDIPIGWPLRYSHSPVEVIAQSDLDALAAVIRHLVAEF